MSIHQTAYFVVRDDALEVCTKAIREFVDYVRENEPNTFLYTSLQEKENPNHFLHYFIFRDENARRYSQLGGSESFYRRPLSQPHRAR